jgi:quinol monooxygenase YgiN
MRLRYLIFSVAALVLGIMGPLDAEETMNGPVYIVTYFDVAPTAAQQSAGIVRNLADASRKDDANVGFQVFEEIGRPNRLAILEAWRDKKAYEANGETAAAAAFRDKLQPLLISGTGARFLDGLSVAAPAARPGPETVYVLTHVDVPPQQKEQAIELVKALAAAGRKDDGNLWFDVLQQNDRPNHFTLFEGWRDRKAFDASISAAHTKEFRQKLNPLEGALYDERLYQAVR